MSKHTPGPWHFYADVPNWHVVTNASRMRVLANVHIEPGNEMDLANVRLIAAAPELLAAVEGLLNALPSATTHPAIQAARAAIAKATGERS